METETNMKLEIVDPGSAKECRPAILDGECVRITVYCGENFGDPLPWARLLVASVDLLAAAKEVPSPIDNEGFCDGCPGFDGIENYVVNGMKATRQTHKKRCWYGQLRAAIDKAS